MASYLHKCTVYTVHSQVPQVSTDTGVSNSSLFACSLLSNNFTFLTLSTYLVHHDFFPLMIV